MTNPAGSVLVTGATGHLGASLVRELAARGTRVVALARGQTSPHALRGVPGVESVRCDVLDLDGLRPAIDGVDAVYHLAAKISLAGDADGSVQRTNVEGTKNVLTAAREAGVTRFVHCSSVHAFDYLDESLPDINEATPLAEDDGRIPAYDRSKAAAQREVLRAAGEGLNTVIVHPSGLIGPHDFAPSAMGRTFLDLRDRKMPMLIDGGFDFVDARDVAVGMIAACERGSPGRSYLLTGHFCTIAQLARTCAEVTGVRPPKAKLSLRLARRIAPLAQWGARITGRTHGFTPEAVRTLALRVPFNSARARRELGFQARPLIESVRDVYEDFAKRGL